MLDFQPIKDAYNSNKLHVILRLALDDFKVIINSDKYIVNLKDWHDVYTPDTSTKEQCYVCVAGSVLANKGFPREEVYINSLEKINENLKLDAKDALILHNFMVIVDYLRKGWTYDAYNYLGDKSKIDYKAYLNEDIEQYEYDKDWHEDYDSPVTIDEYYKSLEDYCEYLKEENL